MIRFFVMFLTVLMTVCLPFTGQAAASFGQRTANMAEIKGIRVSSTADKIRLVVDASKEVDYETVVLSNPTRVVVNLHGAWLSPAVKKNMDLGGTVRSEYRAHRSGNDGGQK